MANHQDSDAFGRCVRCGHHITTNGCERCQISGAPPYNDPNLTFTIYDENDVRTEARRQAFDEAIAVIDKTIKHAIYEGWGAETALRIAGERLVVCRDNTG